MGAFLLETRAEKCGEPTTGELVTFGKDECVSFVFVPATPMEDVPTILNFVMVF